MKTIIYYLSAAQKQIDNSNLLNTYSYLQKLIRKKELNDRIKYSLPPSDEVIAINQGHGSLTYYIHHFSGDLSSLCVLLDLQCEQVKEANEIAKLIVCYPEVSFYFLHPVENFVNTLGKNFLDYCPDEIINVINKEPLEISFDDIVNINSDSQLFDSSNIRSSLCQLYHKKWHFPDNFKLIRDSRASHYALIVDSDVYQCQLSAYSLYSCGYRCSTISMAGKLKKIKDSKDGPSPNLIIRDFDLQFQDLPSDGNQPPFPVQHIRGYMKDKEERNNKWIDLYKGNNPYWKPEDKAKMYHLSYKYENIRLTDMIDSSRPVGNNDLRLRGWSKPLAGVYYPFFKHVGETETIFDKSHPKKWDEKTTQRGDGNHFPVKIYDDAADMVRRAGDYYNNGNYIVSAVVAQSAVEYLNRFYRALSLKAYSIQALAENAIAMSVQGGNEQELAKDAKIRVDEIKRMVEYLYDDDETICNTNTILQIFADCRMFCKEKEHFDSEDVFIAAMAELNEGGLRPLIKKIKDFFTS